MSDHPGFSPDSSEERRRRATGVWGGYLAFALFLLFLVVFDAQAAYQQRWGTFAGLTVFTLLFLIGPTGGMIWLRRALKDQHPPTPPGPGEPSGPPGEPPGHGSHTDRDQP